MKALFDGHIVPIEDLQRVQPVDGRQGVQFVQTRHNSPIFNVCQPADVHNEIRTPPARGQFVTGPLHITISQSESLAGLPQTKTRKHQFLVG